MDALSGDRVAFIPGQLTLNGMPSNVQVLPSADHTGQVDETELCVAVGQMALTDLPGV